MNRQLKILTGSAVIVALSGFASASFITSSGDASLSGGNVIDFEDQTLGTYTSLTIDDVTFSADDNNLRLDDTYQQYNQTGIYLDNGTYAGNGFSSLSINFDGGTSAFGFNWGMAESFASWELTAYDASDTLIESYVLPSTGASSAGEFYGIAASGISYATLSWSGSYDWIGIDNFTYQAAVPEPATLGLLTLGLLGLTMSRKNKAA